MTLSQETKLAYSTMLKSPHTMIPKGQNHNSNNAMETAELKLLATAAAY